MTTRRKLSATTYVLLALVPYTKQNLLLSFSPNRFFNELDKTTPPFPRKTLREAYIRAEKAKLITIEQNKPRLTLAGKRKVQPYIAKTLSKDVYVMVIFDIPKATDWVRRRFRLMLKELEFVQIQQSVWATKQDHIAIVEEMVNELKLTHCVQVFEAARILPRQ